MDKESIKRLEWFLRFLATDLNRLKVEKHNKLAAEGTYYLIMGKAKVVAPDFVQDMRDRKRKKEFISWINETYMTDPGAEIKLIGTNLRALQAALKEGVKDVFTRIEAVKNGDRDSVAESFLGAESVDFMCEISIKENGSEPYFSKREYFRNRPYKVIVFQFMRCLHEVPISAFHKCPECGHWFINVTKREKIYCTSLCASRHIVRRKRKDSKNLKREGAERARKSYKKRVKAEHPKAKIERRPYKYKDQ